MTDKHMDVFHTLHEAADRLDHYLDTFEQSTAARVAGRQLSDEVRKVAESDYAAGRTALPPTKDPP